MKTDLKSRVLNTNKFDSLKLNYIVNTADGALFALAMGMVPLSTVLIYFISDFVSAKWLIGLLTFLNVLLTFSPQVLVSKKLERLRYNKPFLLFTSLILRVLWLLMGLNVILFAEKMPILFIILFYFLYSLIGLISAFTGITWLNFIIKIIPKIYWAKFFAVRSSISGIFEAVGSILMGIIVSRFPYPYNYGILFIVVFVISMVSLWALTFSHESETVTIEEKGNEGSYVSKMINVLKFDLNFRNYLITVALIGGFGKMAFAFQTVFAKEKLGIDLQQVSYATFILLASQTIGYLIWGLIADKYGFKVTLELSAAIFFPTIFLTFLMTNLTVFYLSMSLFGLAQSARNVNENNLAVNLCRGENQPLYIGLRNLLMGPAFALSPVFAGLIYDFSGYNILFIISSVSMASGLYILLRFVKEYR